MCEPCLDSGLKKPTVKRHFSAENSEINAGERGSSTATWLSPPLDVCCSGIAHSATPQLKRQKLGHTQAPSSTAEAETLR